MKECYLLESLGRVRVFNYYGNHRGYGKDSTAYERLRDREFGPMAAPRIAAHFPERENAVAPTDRRRSREVKTGRAKEVCYDR
jgi:hypothetical protein